MLHFSFTLFICLVEIFFSTKIRSDEQFWSKTTYRHPLDNVNIKPNGVYDPSAGGSQIMGGRGGHSYCQFQGDFENIFFHGGYGYDCCSADRGLLNDVWRWNFKTKVFEWLAGNTTIDVVTQYPSNHTVEGGYPGGTAEHGMVCMDNNLYIIDGKDVWMLDLNSKKWTWLSGTEDVVIGTPYIWGESELMWGYVVPFENNRTVAVVRPNSNEHIKIFLYNFTSYLTMITFYNSSTPPWMYKDAPKGVYSSGNVPGGRTDFSTWKNSESEIFVHSGICRYPWIVVMDIWSYSFDLRMWKFVAGSEKTSSDYYNTNTKLGELTEDTFPTGRTNHAMTVYNGVLYAAFGLGSYPSTGLSVELGDIYAYDFALDKWYFLFGYPYFVYSKYEYEYSFYTKISGRLYGSLHITKTEYDDPVIVVFGGYAFEEDSSEDSVCELFSVRNVFSCFGKKEYETTVCNGKGTCISNNTCICNSGFYGRECRISTCNNVLSNETGKAICKNHGVCISGRCNCLQNYEGNDCEFSICGGKRSDENDVCNGNGICSFLSSECECAFHSFGDFCENKIFLFFLLDYWYFPLFSICVVCIIIVVGGMSIIIMILCIIEQRKKVRLFKELDDVDLLLEEQRLSRQNVVARLKINRDLFKIDFDKEIVLQKLLGGGGSGCKVFLAEWKGKKVAYKSFQKSAHIIQNQDSFDEFEREVSILASISHPNILIFFGAVINLKRLGIVIEICKKGDLESFILKQKLNRNKEYPIKEKCRFLAEISSGQCFLHSRNIIHRDLKPQNVGVKEKTLTMKIMDFGISKIVRSENQKTKKVGTSFYMAPEVISGNYDKSCDVFSFGVMIFTIVTENFLPYGRECFNVELKVSKDPNFRPKIVENEWEGDIKQNLLILARRCWNHNATKRPSFVAIGVTLSKLDKFYFHGKQVNEKNKEIMELKKIIEKRKIVLESYLK